MIQTRELIGILVRRTRSTGADLGKNLTTLQKGVALK